MIAIQIVATFAAVEIWRGSKLPLVLVFVAIGAGGELNFVQRSRTRRDVTFCTAYRRVFAKQRIRCGRMLIQPEVRGFESLHCMTARTLAVICTFHKLSAVRIRVVAVGAFLESNWLLEVGVRVAALAAYARMLPDECIGRFRVIELVAERSNGNSLPGFCVMARLACSGKATAMRIAVTRTTSVESQADILGMAIIARGMASFARDLLVQPG